MKKALIILMMFLMVTPLLAAQAPRTSAANPIDLQIAIGNSEKCIREGVVMEGTVTQNGLPVTNALVALVVQDYRNNSVVCRTLSVGNPNENWPVQITAISINDTGFNPINVAKTGTTINVQATVHNPQASDRPVFVVVSVTDASSAPLSSGEWSVTIAIGGSVTFFLPVDIPKWATSGVATVYCSVFSKDLASGGFPYVPEGIAHFFISKYEQGTKEYSIPNPPPSPGQGQYTATFRSSPGAIAGNYFVYAIARVSSTQFSSMQTAGYSIADISYPPEASFAYSPIYPYKNMTVTFDASFSSAGGYNDTIVSYAWDWGDGQKNVTTSPTITKMYTGSPYSYLVTLNVTNSAGLSATASKEIQLTHPNPTAVFEWTPPRGVIPNPIAFNASSCDAGWDENLGAYATISEYKWNFGDNTGNTTTSSPHIQSQLYVSRQLHDCSPDNKQ